MAVRFNIGARNTLLAYDVEYLTALNVPPWNNPGAVLDIYTGSQPASANNAAPGTLLVSIANILWAAPSGGSVALAGALTGTAVATGTAAWGRLHDPGVTARIDGTVGVAGTEFIIDNTTIMSGGTVTLTGCTLTQPAS